MMEATLTNIRQILKEDVSPTLALHHGDVEVLDFEDGILSIRLLGQCGNCPSAIYTVENVIEKTLKDKFAAIKKVQIETSINPEFIRMAKEILSKKN